MEAFLVHYQFEAIHPFMDGNGRVGRLLLTVIIEEWCGLSNQWLYMSAYFDRNADEYIDRRFNVSCEGAWEEWIEFCLKVSWSRRMTPFPAAKSGSRPRSASPRTLLRSSGEEER